MIAWLGSLSGGRSRRMIVVDASGRAWFCVSPRVFFPFSFFFTLIRFTACIVSLKNPHVLPCPFVKPLNVTFTLYYKSRPGNEPLVPRIFEVPLCDIATSCVRYFFLIFLFFISFSTSSVVAAVNILILF